MGKDFSEKLFELCDIQKYLVEILFTPYLNAIIVIFAVKSVVKYLESNSW